ncbi:MAG: hypothetical protein FWC70_08905 [Defluviitaleaceae bacterium]|nr:hypothetical protein [Defluviitaleaceae bacterium]
MTGKICTVNVADIAEYPTQLGATCKLLNVYGINAYSDTEESIMQKLVESVDNPDDFEICKSSSRCGAFWVKYQQGVTPFIDREKIQLRESGGNYWVAEGKHRTCMAMRCGAKTIEAEVVHSLHSPGERMIPSIGNAGEYCFEWVLNRKKFATGSVPVLWMNLPTHLYDENFPVDGILILDERFDTRGELKEVAPGISYSVKKEKVGLLRTKKTVAVKVKIIKDHYKTRIWLMRMELKKIRKIERLPLVSDADTLYRTGCWREHHQAKTAHTYFPTALKG